MRLVCFHLYNDYSGSPKILNSVLRNLLRKGIKVDLITSKGGVLDGLRGVDGVRVLSYPYAFSDNHILTMFRFLLVQIYTQLISLQYLFQKEIVFYINTLLPVGPALIGRLMGKRVVYHYHENAITKGVVYRFLCKVMEWLASDIICVSEYQKSFLHREKNVYVVPNAVSEDFVRRVTPNISQAFQKKKVLMLGSLKVYKGTLEYIQLANQLREFKFDLIVNDTMDNISAFLEIHKIEIPCNLTIYSRQSDVIPFYSNASLVLN